MFLGTNGVITPPNVSIPNVNGVTSNNTISLTSPAKTPACTAAPTATTSSGLTDWFGYLPVYSFTKACTAGIRVEPPTNTTSSISPLERPASCKASATGFLHLSSKS